MERGAPTVLAAASLIMGGCVSEGQSPERETQTSAHEGSSSSAPPSYEVIADALGYTTMQEVLDQASVIVQARVSRRLGLDVLEHDPRATWVMWELVVEDALDADVPATLTVVDVDWPEVSMADVGVPYLVEGQVGLFALDSHDTETALLHPGHGKTYHPVAVFERTQDGFRDVSGQIDPFASLEAYREVIEADNARTRP